MTVDDILKYFPNLKANTFEITSPNTHQYNCIAWAANNNSKWYEPDPHRQYYWPQHIPREYNLKNYIVLFQDYGYKISKNDSYIEGYEKVAIFTNQAGIPTHASRQLGNNRWTSKLGAEEDITHFSLNGIQGTYYGSVAVILERQIIKSKS